MKKHSMYMSNTPVYPVLASKYDRCMPVLSEGSIEHSKIYCVLMIILITKAHATGDGVWTLVDYMQKHSMYILNTPVSSTSIKIWLMHVLTTRRKHRIHKHLLWTYDHTNYQGSLNWGRSLYSSWLNAKAFHVYVKYPSIQYNHQSITDACQYYQKEV